VSAIRVLVVDDDALMRAGLRGVLASDDGIAVVGEAADGGEAIARVAALAPDVVLMDVRMPGLDGIAATREVLAASADVRVLILTTFEQDDYVFGALRAGASGFLLKRARPEDLLAAVRAIAAGDALLSPSVTRTVIERLARGAADDEASAAADTDGLADLTAREREVLDLLARGLSNAEIAAALVIEESTVKTHVKRVLTKLGLRDRVQAVIYAYERGLARPATRG
jgi:DNA-binding NarL/FixJ family response regulator